MTARRVVVIGGALVWSFLVWQSWLLEIHSVGGCRASACFVEDPQQLALSWWLAGTVAILLVGWVLGRGRPRETTDGHDAPATTEARLALGAIAGMIIYGVYGNYAARIITNLSWFVIVVSLIGMLFGAWVGQAVFVRRTQKMAIWIFVVSVVIALGFAIETTAVGRY